MDIKEKVEKVKAEAAKYGAKVVAATKYLDIEGTKKIIEAGINEIGENRADMFLEKYEALKDYDIKWHFFGVVQSRKVRDLANRIDCLHTLDRLSIAMEFDKRLEKPLDCFVQVNISDEPNKSGVTLSKVKPLIKSLAKCSKIRVIGLMCIARLTNDEEELARSFKKMQEMKEEVEEMGLDYAPCHELSMGMSNDYRIALQYGSTLIRIGSKFTKYINK